MRTAAQRLGDAAEALVAGRLSGSGWTIHARNVRVGRNEIDLIATDPGPPPALVFVEVRWRARRDFGLAEETVDHRKRQRLRCAAFRLLGREAESSRRRVSASGPAGADPLDLPRLPIRFDLIVAEPNGVVRHHRNAW